MLAPEIQEQALKLNDLEKIRLIEMLMDDLDRPSPQVEKLWIEESEKRYKAYKQGKVKGIPLEVINENTNTPPKILMHDHF